MVKLDKEKKKLLSFCKTKYDGINKQEVIIPKIYLQAGLLLYIDINWLTGLVNPEKSQVFVFSSFV